MSGSVKISRDIFDHGTFKAEPFSEREAWIWMIMQARWKDGKARVGDFVVDLVRGQLAASVRFMAKAWDWTAAKVQRYLERLKKCEMISSKTDTGVSVITICNYDKYQFAPDTTDTGPIQDRYTSDTKEKKDVRKEEREEEKKEEAQAPANSPSEIVSTLEAWASPSAVSSFIAYRRRSKAKALTMTAAKRLAQNLKAIFNGGGNPDDALGMAEERGWQTVQPDWYFNAVNPQPKGRKNGEGQAFGAAIHRLADRLSEGSARIDLSDRDPFAVRPRENPEAYEQRPIPLLRS